LKRARPRAVPGAGFEPPPPEEEELRTVLQDVSFVIAEGEAVGLVGESGSGKSMTARAVARLLPPGAVQSGERFEGVENLREWRRLYAANLAFEMRHLRGEGDLWVAENSISYDGGPWRPTVSILEFRGDKVAHETIYITDRWEAPEWRRPWRAAT
jgi:energy-coupling factor transporter ATP-binding protein EcfA2